MAQSVGRDLLRRIENDEKSISRKDFPWDFFYNFIVTAILGLTVIDIIKEFVVGDSVSCFHPPNTVSVVNSSAEAIYGFTLRQADYINKYCYESTPTTKYLPLLFLVQGLAMPIPHSLWVEFFKGDFDSFFSIARTLTLRFRIGKHRFNLLKKLENQYRYRWIYGFYITKLIAQLIICTVSIGLSAGLFNDFTPNFNCPVSLDKDGKIPEGWPLNSTVSCIYTSLDLFRVVWIVNFILTILAIIVTGFGLIWTVFVPKKILGFKEMAIFLSECSSSIRTKIQPKFLNRISSDLDFLMYLLSRADTIKGELFKDIQVINLWL